MKQLLTLTPAAIDRVRNLLSEATTPCHGLRIGINTKGCSGLAYTMDYVTAVNPQDEKITVEDLTLYVDPKAVLFIVGTEMDFIQDPVYSGFNFTNPNEKGRCGCGKSFHV